MQRQLDNAEAEELRRLAKEVNDAVEARIRGDQGAVEKVRRTTQSVQSAVNPFEYWSAQTWQPLKNVCLVMAQELNVLPIINEHDGAMTADDVAKINGSDGLLIARIMRVLTCVGITEEVAPNTYKANELSRLAGSDGGKAGVKIQNELLFPIAAKLVPYMRQHGFKQFPRRPKEMDPTQFAFDGRTMFEYFKDNSEIKHWFDTLMVENRKGNTPWYTIYPFADELGQACKNQPDKPLLVDVGGNRGADILEFRRAYPQLEGRFILQDLPETIEAVDESTMDGIEAQAYDFFTPQPVQGAKAYFWRWVLHDFNDDQCREFLPNTVRAMDDDSRLLLMELVIPDVGADLKISHLDILMMLYHSGMERSMAQWKALLDSCGLEVVKVWTRPDTDPGVLECRKKR